MLVLMDDVDAGVWILFTFIWAFKIVYRPAVEFDAPGKIYDTLFNPAELDGTFGHIHHLEGVFFGQMTLDQPDYRKILEPLLLNAFELVKCKRFCLNDLVLCR